MYLVPEATNSNRTMPNYTLTKHIQPYDCGPQHVILGHTLTGLLQEAASNHADQLGFGMTDLAHTGSLWALSVLYIEIDRMPAQGMDVKLTTCPSVLSRLRAGREFWGHSKDGAQLFRASSDWMVVDKKTRRAVDPRFIATRYTPHEERALPFQLKRLKPHADLHSMQPDALFRVGQSSLDINGHVNNTEYTRVSLDAMYEAGFRGNLQALWMTFHHESFPGDVIELFTTPAPDENGRVQVTGICRDTPIFCASCVFTSTT